MHRFGYKVLLLAAALLFWGGSFIWHPEPITQGSITFFDRDHHWLFQLKEATISVHVQTIPRPLSAATLVTEDNRYYFHQGIDGLSSMRALKEAFMSNSVQTGASTISQQVSRLLLGINRSRNVLNKAEDVLLSGFLEANYSKAAILQYYLQNSDYGNGNIGVANAIQDYFGLGMESVNWQQATMLAAVLKNAQRYSPYSDTDALYKRMRQIWQTLYDYHLVDTEPLLDVRGLGLQQGQATINAPHFVYFVLHQLEDRFGKNFWHGHNVEVETTLDLALYQREKESVQTKLAHLQDKDAFNSAAVVLDNATGEIVSYIGNNDFFDHLHAGEVDMVQALRQPGSALKPFVYLAAILEGWGTGTVIFDIPSRFLTADGAPYTPLNYDLQFHGPVTVRQALANSYNVPAVKALEFVGVTKLKKLLQQFGITSLHQSDDYYGLSLALGSGEVSLYELTNAYRTLANGGAYSAPVFLRRLQVDGVIKSLNADIPQVSPNQQLQQAISLITDVLKDQKARAPEFEEFNDLSFPFDVAAKTGTSRNFHDNWTVGFSSDYTVGVWTGNADATPMQQVSGITGAGPIFQQIMRNLSHHHSLILSKGLYPTLICLPSGLLPSAYCKHYVEEYFLPGKAPTQTDTWYQVDGLHMPADLSAWGDKNQVQSAVQILKPQEHDIFTLDKEIPDAAEGIPCQVQAYQAKRLVIKLNGNVISQNTVCHLPIKVGIYELQVEAILQNGQIQRQVVHYQVVD